MVAAPDETAAEYMASTLSTSNATSGNLVSNGRHGYKGCYRLPLTASPWRSWCSWISRSSCSSSLLNLEPCSRHLKGDVRMKVTLPFRTT